LPTPPPANWEPDARVPQRVYDVLAKLVADKAAENGSLAAAREWEQRELDAELWARVRGDLPLTPDALEKAWKERPRTPATRWTTYGSGTFIVVRKDASADAKVPKPTAEEWWTAATAIQRYEWLLANYVETSGSFEILRADTRPPNSWRTILYR
jgi:hypothetical protein